MAHEELDMHQIPTTLAARAMNVSIKSIHTWFLAGKLDGEQTVSGRLWVTVASCRALIRERRGLNSPAEADFDHVLMEGELPESPFTRLRAERQEDAVSCA